MYVHNIHECRCTYLYIPTHIRTYVCICMYKYVHAVQLVCMGVSSPWDVVPVASRFDILRAKIMASVQWPTSSIILESVSHWKQQSNLSNSLDQV